MKHSSSTPHTDLHNESGTTITNGIEASSLGERIQEDNGTLVYPPPVPHPTAPPAKMVEDETPDNGDTMKSGRGRKRPRRGRSSMASPGKDRGEYLMPGEDDAYEP